MTISSFHLEWISDATHLGALAGLAAGGFLMLLSGWSHRRSSKPLLASLLACEDRLPQYDPAGVSYTADVY